MLDRTLLYVMFLSYPEKNKHLKCVCINQCFSEIKRCIYIYIRCIRTVIKCQMYFNKTDLNFFFKPIQFTLDM